MKIRITLAPIEVEQILRAHLAQKFSEVGEVELVVGQELVGWHNNEHYAAVFKGASCEVEV